MSWVALGWRAWRLAPGDFEAPDLLGVEASQFADHLIDAVAEEPPCIPVRENSNIRCCTERFCAISLLFQIHSVF